MDAPAAAMKLNTNEIIIDHNDITTSCSKDENLYSKPEIDDLKQSAVEYQPPLDSFGKLTVKKSNGSLTTLEDVNNMKNTWSAVYTNPGVDEKPSICVRNIKKIKINEGITNFDVSKLKKPRTIFFVKKNPKNCLHIESKVNKTGTQLADKENKAKQDETPSNCLDSNMDLHLPEIEEVTTEKSDVQYKENNDYWSSFLEAFDSAEGVSTLFKFPTNNDNRHNAEIVDLDEKKVDNSDRGESDEYRKALNSIFELSHQELMEPLMTNQFISTIVTDHVYSKSMVNRDNMQQKNNSKLRRIAMKTNKRKRTDLDKNNEHSDSKLNSLNNEITTEKLVRTRKANANSIGSNNLPLKRKRTRRKLQKQNTHLDVNVNSIIVNPIIAESIDEYDCPLEETLEFVFKYERFPGSFYMHKLAKNLYQPWKSINIWFMNRRIEAKKNGIMFRIQEFTHCIYCDPLNAITGLAIDHLISETHIATIKNSHASRKEKRNSNELIPIIDSEIAYSGDNSPQVTVPDNGIITSNEISDYKDAYRFITHKCKTCERCFPNKWSLIRHSLTHRDILCDLCNKSFNVSAYKYHVTSHLMLNCGENLRKYCKCTKCYQLECMCQSLYSFSCSNNVNYCNCHKCRKMSRDLELTASGFPSPRKSEKSEDVEFSQKSLCRAVDYGCNSVSPLLKDTEEVYKKHGTCQKVECQCDSASLHLPRSSKINARTKKYLAPYCDPSDSMYELWAAIKKQEDAGKTEIVLPEWDVAIDPIYGRRAIPTSFNNERNINSNGIFSLKYGQHFPCIRKIGFFEEMPDDSSYIPGLADLNTCAKNNYHRESNYCGNLFKDVDYSLNPSSITSYLSAKRDDSVNLCNSIEDEPSETLIFNADVYKNYCLLCEIKISSPTHLLMHTNEHRHHQSVFLCNKCGMKFDEYRKCIEHIFEHLLISLYCCHCCSIRFSKHEDMIRHLRVIHEFTNIDDNSSYNWIFCEQTVFIPEQNADSNICLEHSFIEGEDMCDISNSMDTAVENIVIKDPIRYESNTIQDYNEEIIDLSEIPDSILDLNEVFETVVLTDKIQRNIS